MVTEPVAAASAEAPPAASVVPVWLVPTMRACRPALLAVAGVVALYATAAVVAGSSDVVLPAAYVRLALAALAGAAAWPHDPAATLLAALPVGRGRRLIHRVLVSTSAAVAAWVLAREGVGAVVSVMPGITIADSVPALLALVAVAVAAGSWFGTWGALTPLGLVAGGNLVGGTGPLADAFDLWWSQPWLVTTTAVGVSVLLHRGLGLRRAPVLCGWVH